MLGFGKVTCALCDRQVARREARRVRDQKAFAVCPACYETWERAGRTCERCRDAVRGTQEVGIFLSGPRALGHADCGGALLTI